MIDIENIQQEWFRNKMRRRESEVIRLMSRVLGPLPFPMNPRNVLAMATARGIEFTEIIPPLPSRSFLAAVRRPLNIGDVPEILDREDLS